MRVRLPILALAVLLAGCGADDPTGLAAPAGSYQLVTVNGGPAPGVAYHDFGYTLEVLSGLILLRPDGTFTEVYQFRETKSGIEQPIQSLGCEGSWTRDGHRLTLKETPSQSCSDEATADWDGARTLTVNWASLGIPLGHRR